MSSSSPFPSASFVGVVSEVKRSTINNFISTKCSVFGISEEEYEALKENVSSPSFPTPRLKVEKPIKNPLARAQNLMELEPFS